MELVELKALVAADVIATRNPEAIAAAASVGRVRYVERFATEQTVVNALGILAGETFLQALEGVSSVVMEEGNPLKPYQAGMRRQLAWLKTTGVDVGSAVTRSMLSTLAALGVLEQDSVDAIAELAEQPDPVSELTVRSLLWAPDGQWLGE